MRRRQARSARWPGWKAVVAALVLTVTLPLLFGSGNLAPARAAPVDDSPMLDQTANQGDYIIGPQDKIRIRVFDIKDLDNDEEQVDANGQIQIPMIGRVTAAGKTAGQLRDELANDLTRYLQKPEVSVAVMESASLKVTVQGEVKNPGVFPIRGKTTLMQAIAMAGGPSDIANLHKVAVIRETDGVRRAAMLDYSAIQSGKAGDPLIQSNDVVVLQSSGMKSAWSQVLKNLPIFTMLAYLR